MYDIVINSINVLLGNSSVNTVNVQQWRMCLSGRMLLLVARQQRTNEDAGWESCDLFSVWSAFCNTRTVFSVCGLCRVLIREVNSDAKSVQGS
jgi:hypothetical protein